MRGNASCTDCGSCPFAKDGKPNKPVFGKGAEKPLFIICGEGPGKNEVRLGEPFVGKSGKMLNLLLKKAKVKREEVWITNAVLCYKPGASEAAKQKARDCCKPRLDKELEQWPKIPLQTMGAVAAQVVLEDPKYSVMKSVGAAQTFKDRTVLTSIHPSWILKLQGKEDHEFVSLAYDVGKLVAHARGQLDLFKYDLFWEISDVDRAGKLVVQAIESIYKHGWGALDTETSGRVTTSRDVWGEEVEHKHSALEPFYADLIAMGLATPDLGVSVPWGIVPAAAKERLREALADPNITWVFHNKPYDIPVLEANGMPVNGKTEDTLLMHHNVFPGLRHGLQRVVAQFNLVRPWKAEFRDSDKTTYDSEEGLEYNAQDSLGTARSYESLQVLIRSKKPKTYELDEEMASIGIRMHRFGAPVCRKKNLEIANYFKPIVMGIEDQFRQVTENKEVREEFFDRLASEQAKKKRKADSTDYHLRVVSRREELVKKFDKGKYEFKLGAPIQVAAYLLMKGVPLKQKTKTGALSTGAEILMDLAHHPAVGDLLRYRGLKGVYTKDVVNLATFLDEFDRAHPSWRVNLITGRWASTLPMVSNLTKGDGRLVNGVLVDKEGKPIVAKSATDGVTPNIREQYVAPPGKILVGADLAQADARVVAVMSADPTLLAVFNSDRDIHTEVAQEIWGKDAWNALSKEKRTKAREVTKTAEYGWFYGAADGTIHKGMIKRGFTHIRLGQIARMTAIISRRFKGIASWQNQILKDAHLTKKVSSILLGREQHFPLGRVDKNVVLNFAAQATVADIMNLAMKELVDRLKDIPGAFPFLQVHDAIYIECDEDDGDRVGKILEDCMTTEVTYKGTTMLFPADYQVGRSLADV